MEVDPDAIIPVAVLPAYCSECGAELASAQFEGHELPWCPDCRYLFGKNPVPGVQVIVHDDDSVLFMQEEHDLDHLPDGTWNLPGGHASPDEPPAEAALRELAEETGVEGDPEDLSLLTVYHGRNPRTSYYLITYALRRSDAVGEPRPGPEAAEVAFLPVSDVLSEPGLTRDSDRERVAMLFDEPSPGGEAGAT